MLHLLAHRPEAPRVEKICLDLEVEPFRSPLVFAEGSFAVPEGPGLGVEADREALEPFRLA